MTPQDPKIAPNPYKTLRFLAILEGNFHAESPKSWFRRKSSENLLENLHIILWPFPGLEINRRFSSIILGPHHALLCTRIHIQETFFSPGVSLFILDSHIQGSRISGSRLAGPKPGCRVVHLIRLRGCTPWASLRPRKPNLLTS